MIQKQLADTNKLWSAVQSGAGEKTRQLREAEALSKAFTETADAVELWLGQAEAQLIAEPAWIDFERVQEQLKHHKVGDSVLTCLGEALELCKQQQNYRLV